MIDIVLATCDSCQGEFDLELTVHHGASFDTQDVKFLPCTCPDCNAAYKRLSAMEEAGFLARKEEA